MVEILQNDLETGKLKEESISTIEPRCVETHGRAPQSN